MSQKNCWLSFILLKTRDHTSNSQTFRIHFKERVRSAHAPSSPVCAHETQPHETCCWPTPQVHIAAELTCVLLCCAVWGLAEWRASRSRTLRCNKEAAAAESTEQWSRGASRHYSCSATTTPTPPCLRSSAHRGNMLPLRPSHWRIHSNKQGCSADFHTLTLQQDPRAAGGRFNQSISSVGLHFVFIFRLKIKRRSLQYPSSGRKLDFKFLIIHLPTLQSVKNVLFIFYFNLLKKRRSLRFCRKDCATGVAVQCRSLK